MKFASVHMAFSVYSNSRLLLCRYGVELFPVPVLMLCGCQSANRHDPPGWTCMWLGRLVRSSHEVCLVNRAPTTRGTRRLILLRRGTVVIVHSFKRPAYARVFPPNSFE